MSEMMLLWIGVIILTIAIEAATMGLTTVWFAGGAFVALLAELLNAGIYLQVVLFLSISLILLYFTRPVAVKYFNKGRVKTNLDGLVGKQAVVISAIHNLNETGQVVVEGKEWTARSTNASKSFEAGEVVRIHSIQGVKLIVEEVETL